MGRSCGVHRIREWLGLAGILEIIPPARAASPGAGCAGISRDIKSPRWLFKISREGDFTICLRSLFQCALALRRKTFFLIFRWNSLCFSLCLLPLVLLLSTTGKSLGAQENFFKGNFRICKNTKMWFSFGVLGFEVFWEQSHIFSIPECGFHSAFLGLGFFWEC